MASFPEMVYNLLTIITDSPDNSTIPAYPLKNNNPLVNIICYSTGTTQPDIEVMTSTLQGRVVGFGESPNRGYTATSSSSNTMLTTYRDPARVALPSDPLAVTYMGKIGSQKNYRLLHHGTDRRLYELLWNGKSLSAREVIMQAYA